MPSTSLLAVLPRIIIDGWDRRIMEIADKIEELNNTKGLDWETRERLREIVNDLDDSTASKA
jgi:hypothetical protein